MRPSFRGRAVATPEAARSNFDTEHNLKRNAPAPAMTNPDGDLRGGGLGLAAEAIERNST